MSRHRPDLVAINPGADKPQELIEGKDDILCDDAGVYYTHGARFTRDDYKPYRHSVDEKGRGLLIRKDEPDLFFVRGPDGALVSPRVGGKGKDFVPKGEATPRPDSPFKRAKGPVQIVRKKRLTIKEG